MAVIAVMLSAAAIVLNLSSQEEAYSEADLFLSIAGAGRAPPRRPLAEAGRQACSSDTLHDLVFTACMSAHCRHVYVCSAKADSSTLLQVPL